MSVGAVISHSRSRPSDRQFVGDLAGLFERRHIALGEPHVSEQLEILLTTSDGFRSQLFTLCTAISHMSEHDLSGEELLDLIARALGTETLSPPVRATFLAGFNAWNNRSVSGEDEWPPRKKPVASAPAAPPSARIAEFPAPIGEPAATTERPAPAQRPGGIPTMQEALELARIRGGNRPLRPEVVPAAVEEIPAETATDADSNTAAIHELTTLLRQIEERMDRLRAQEQAPPAAPAPRHPAVDYRALDILKPGVDVSEMLPPEPEDELLGTPLPGAPAFPRREGAVSVPKPPMLDALAVHESAPLARTEPELVEPAEEVIAQPSRPDELRLIPRTTLLDPVERPKKAAPPTLVIPEALKFKTYLAIAVLGGIVLIGAPISAVTAYRYMHPLYMHQPAPQPAPVVQPVEPQPAEQPVKKSRRKAQPVRRPPVQVWPPQPQQ